MHDCLSIWLFVTAALSDDMRPPFIPTSPRYIARADRTRFGAIDDILATGRQRTRTGPGQGQCIMPAMDAVLGILFEAPFEALQGVDLQSTKEKQAERLAKNWEEIYGNVKDVVREGFQQAPFTNNYNDKIHKIAYRYSDYLEAQGDMSQNSQQLLSAFMLPSPT